MPPAQFIRQMLSTHIYLDKFTKLLSQHTSIDDVRGFIYLFQIAASPTHMAAVHPAPNQGEMEYGDEKLTYEQLLLQCVSPDHFSRDVLSLFDDSASQLTHAKVQHRLSSAKRCRGQYSDSLLGSCFSR